MVQHKQYYALDPEPGPELQQEIKLNIEGGGRETSGDGLCARAAAHDKN